MKLPNPVRVVRNWLRVKYIQFVEMITFFMLSRSEKLVNKMILLKGRDFSDPYTSWMLNRTGTLVRAALVSQGKDPDYVAPPPAPPKPVEVVRPRPVFGGPPFDVGTYWIRNPSSHPVLESRRQFAEKQAKLKAKLFPVPALAPEPEPVLQVTEEPEVLRVAANEEASNEEVLNEESK